MSKYAGLTLEELKKLRCMVVNDDVPVPGCICVPSGDDGRDGRGRYGDTTSSEGLGGSERGSSGSRDRKGYGRDHGGKLTVSYDWGGIFDWGGIGWGGAYGLGESDISEGEEEGAGPYIREYDYLRFFVEPCDKILSHLSSSSGISCEEPKLQRSIAIVRPEAMIYKDAILRAIFEAGFQIVGKRVLHLTPEQVSEIYSKYYGTPSFPHLVVSVSSGPVLVLSIAALNVVNRWKKMIGPDGSVRADWFFPLSMRKRFGLAMTKANMLHGSENVKESNQENRYFYPDGILEPILLKSDQVADYCNLFVNPTLLIGLTEVVKKKPGDPIRYLAEWLLTNNPFQPRFPTEIALAPT